MSTDRGYCQTQLSTSSNCPYQTCPTFPSTHSRFQLPPVPPTIVFNISESSGIITNEMNALPIVYSAVKNKTGSDSTSQSCTSPTNPLIVSNRLPYSLTSPSSLQLRPRSLSDTHLRPVNNVAGEHSRSCPDLTNLGWCYTILPL